MGFFNYKNAMEEASNNASNSEMSSLDKVIDSYALNELNEKDLDSLKKTISHLLKNRFFYEDSPITFAREEEEIKITYLDTLAKQNLLIIKELSKLNSNIEELIKK